MHCVNKSLEDVHSFLNPYHPLGGKALIDEGDPRITSLYMITGEWSEHLDDQHFSKIIPGGLSERGIVKAVGFYSPTVSTGTFSPAPPLLTSPWQVPRDQCPR